MLGTRHAIGGVAGGAQRARQAVGEQRVVFNDEEAHDLL